MRLEGDTEAGLFVEPSLQFGQLVAAILEFALEDDLLEDGLLAFGREGCLRGQQPEEHAVVLDEQRDSPPITTVSEPMSSAPSSRPNGSAPRSAKCSTFIGRSVQGRRSSPTATGSGGSPATARTIGGVSVATIAVLAARNSDRRLGERLPEGERVDGSGAAMRDWPKSNAVARCWSRRRGWGGMNTTRYDRPAASASRREMIY